MSDGSWGAFGAAVIAALAMVWQARINGKATSQTSLDDRATDTLNKAMAWQAEQIRMLTTRVAHLEREVEACEKGRAEDRASFSRALSEIRDRLTDDGPWPEIPAADVPPPAI